MSPILVPGRILKIQDVGETGLLTLAEPSPEPNVDGQEILLHIEGEIYRRDLRTKRLRIGDIAVFECQLKDSHAGGYTLSVNTDKSGKILYFPSNRQE